jgi:hypothetical protein
MTDTSQAVGHAAMPDMRSGGSLHPRTFLFRAPVHLWLLCLVVAPNLLLLITSFMQSSGGDVIWQPSLKNYVSLFTSYTIQYLAFKTLLVSFCSAAVATARLLHQPPAFARQGACGTADRDPAVDQPVDADLRLACHPRRARAAEQLPPDHRSRR